jgi:hypothetical protein
MFDRLKGRTYFFFFKFNILKKSYKFEAIRIENLWRNIHYLKNIPASVKEAISLNKAKKKFYKLIKKGTYDNV